MKFARVALNGLLCLSLTVIGANKALAEDNSFQLGQSVQDPSQSAADDKAPEKIKATDAHRALKSIGDTVHHIRRSALDIIGEVERQDLVVVSEPDMFGPVVVPAIPMPDGVMAMGDYLPPRKKWLDIFVNQLDQLLPVLYDEANSSACDSKEWADLKGLVSDAQRHLATLKEVAGAEKLDRLAIGKQALGIYDDMTNIDKERKKIFRQSPK